MTVRDGGTRRGAGGEEPTKGENGASPSHRKDGDGPPRPISIRESVGTSPTPAPTPVRQVMEGEDRADPVAEDPPPTRTFDADGTGWIVRVEGRTRSGTAPDSGAPLLHLVFYHDDDPDAPRKQLVHPGRTLANLAEEELAELLHRARPWTPPPEPPPRRSGKPRRGR